MANLLTKAFNYVEASLDQKLRDLQAPQPQEGFSWPGAEALAKGEKMDGTIGRRGLIFDPFLDQGSSHGLYKYKSNYLSNTVLKQVSRRDPIVAAIIDTRAGQVMSACKKQTNRFDMGFKIVPKDKSMKPDDEEVRKIEEFILNTGHTNDRSDADKMTFDQWGYMVARDFMIYGHAAIEKVKRGDGDLYSFLPLSAETIYYANKKAKAQTLQHFRELWQNAAQGDSAQKEAAPVKEEEYEFIQVINGQVTEGFTKEEMIFARFNLESDIDLNGYSFGPLERAIQAITSHMQIENHQKQFFTHGTASKGLLVIQGDVAPNTLKTLQAQWNNQITGPLNAWRTPILAGIKNANWIPLTMSNRDAEYLSYQDHILRTIFSCFAIDPEEVGFGYLSKGTEQRSLGESSNEWKITASRDRGLRPILGRIEAIINEDILPSFSKTLSKKYHFTFVGLDAETEVEETERLQAETGLHTTLNEAREQTERKPLPYGGDLILNPVLLQYLEKNLPKGVFMETFMGVQGASQRPDLQYIPDPLWFQYQQIQMQQMQMMAGGAPGGQPGQDPNQPQDPNAPQDPNDPNAQQQQDEQQAMQEQQMAAIQQYMEANPELFKSLKANLQKADDLRKSEAEKAKVISTEHVSQMTEKLMRDFNWASNKLIKEIFQEVKADLSDDKE